MSSKDWKWVEGNIRQVDDGRQIDGQQTMSFISDGSVELKEEYIEPELAVADENGVVETESTALELIKGGRFDAKMFHEQYEDNTERVLYALLAMQSNANPLKKGGDSIAFRCSAIIIQNRQNYTVPQNTLLDIITARMSSYPENNYYTISAREFRKELPYKDRAYVYKLMSETCKELNRSPFIFEVELGNGKKKLLEFQWNEVLTYNGGDELDSDEYAYISFVPTKFFRILTLSSTIMHGAHFSVGVSAQISSKYARNLFYFLEDMKGYREYPGATPGVFTLSLEDIKYMLKIPASYTSSDIRRYVLEPAGREINGATGIDFVFNYELLKSDNGAGRRKVSSVKFIISKVVAADQKESLRIEKKESQDDSAVLQVLKGIGLMEIECDDVLKKYKANERDLVFLTQAIASVLTMKNVKSKCALLCYIMDNGLNSSFSVDENNRRAASKFNNFEQNNYDFDLLEKELVENQ